MEEVMFDSLALENPKRKWATLMSFTLETAFLGMLITAPLAFTDKLPSLKIGELLVAPTRMAPAPITQPAEAPPAGTHTTSELNPDMTLVEPQAIPKFTPHIVDEKPIAPTGWGIEGAPLGVANTDNPLMNTLLKPHVDAGPPPAAHVLVKISKLDPGFLIHRVQPAYPRNAVITRTEGTVVLAALIDTSGRITQLRAVSGHPLLIPAAIDAVRQWRYKPYILNGSPVEVETQVSVIFNLNR